MGIRDFKIPKMKFKKMKIHTDMLEELNEFDFEAIEKKNIRNRTTPYEDVSDYKTVKEFFLKSVKQYADYPCILEKPNHKEPYKTITYAQFGQDVFSLGTALIHLLNLKDKRVLIIGENQYGWYVSYMAMLCGVGIAVPTDKELPLNELENIINRSNASSVIYSPKRADDMKKLAEKLPQVEYFIEMKSDQKIQDKFVGLEYLIEIGNRMRQAGNCTFEDIEIDEEEFKILFFTSRYHVKLKRRYAKQSKFSCKH